MGTFIQVDPVFHLENQRHVYFVLIRVFIFHSLLIYKFATLFSRHFLFAKIYTETLKPVLFIYFSVSYTNLANFFLPRIFKDNLNIKTMQSDLVVALLWTTLVRQNCVHTTTKS